MNKFICGICYNELNLIVKTEEESLYTITKDGEIEFLDNRSISQTLNLECSECGKTYTFDNDLLVVENKPVLKIQDINNYKNKNISKLDLILK